LTHIAKYMLPDFGDLLVKLRLLATKTQYLVLLVFVLSICMYPITVLYDINVSEKLISEKKLFPLDLRYSTLEGENTVSTISFAITYNISYVLRAENIYDVKLLVFNYTCNKVQYMNKINKTLYEQLYLTKDKAYEELLLNSPKIYFIGKETLRNLINSKDTIGIRIGNNVVEHKYIVIDDYVLIYRTNTIVKIPWLGNTSFAAIVVRVARINHNEIPTNMNDYKLTLYYIEQNGLAYKIIYGFGVEGQNIVLELRDNNNYNLDKYLSLTSIYERISSVDFGKIIDFNIVLFFIAVIAWSILVEYFENFRASKKSLIIGFSALVIATLSYFSIITMFNPYLLPIMFIGLTISMIPLLVEPNNKNSLFIGSLIISCFIVLSLYTILLLIWVPGSIYKIGIEAGIINPTETGVNINLLLEKGLKPVIILKEYAYYYIVSSLYTQLVSLLVIFSSLFLITLMIRARKYEYIFLALMIIAVVILIEPTIRIDYIFKIFELGVVPNENQFILSYPMLTVQPMNEIGIYSFLLFLIPFYILYFKKIMYSEK